VTSNFPLLLFLAAAIAIAAVFVAVARSTENPATVDYARASRLRGVFFLSLSVTLAIFLVMTLPRLPYPVQAAAAPEQIVNVVGKQYAFSLSEGPGPQSLATWDAEYSPLVEVRTGSVVEFRVRSLDVNHGFSIYTPEGAILAQTQAMPGYVNRLRVRFERPGTYRVMCLEYCGLSHHAMRGVIEVMEGVGR
jgi:cytochrome c oxidase subunit 2